MELEQLQTEILAGLASLDGIQQVTAMPRRRDQVTLPAVFVDLVELEPGRDPGTGELAVISHWEARIVVADREPDSVIWNFVQAAMFWLFNHDWPSDNLGRAQLKQAAPDHFSPEFQGHRLWLIEWTHELRVGESIWNNEGIIPERMVVQWPGGSAEELAL